MKHFIPTRNQKWIGLGLFTIGLMATVIALHIPALSAALRDLERSGYFGAVVVGVMYGLSLTSATATLVFANIPDRFDPILIALAGGFGAMLYDVSIFAVSRRVDMRERVNMLTDAILHHHRLPRWLSFLIGGLLISSPLPDELGAGFLALSNAPVWLFLLLSFSFNAFGILVITGLF